jgi:glycerate 2-kinase
MAAAVGYKFYASEGELIQPSPARFCDIAVIEPPLRPLHLEVNGLSDVETTLTGKGGAIHTFGPQKGLTPSVVDQLDKDLTQLVLRIEKQLGTNFSNIPRSGAAGGLGYGILTFLGGKLLSGFDFLAQNAKLADHVAEADLVITGEGKLDQQTLHGKGPIGIATMSSNYHKPVWAVVGVIEDPLQLAPYFTKIKSLVDENTSLAEALQDPQDTLFKRVRALLLDSAKAS